MMPVGGRGAGDTSHKVSFEAPRRFRTAFCSDLKETFFPDDPFYDFKGKSLPVKAKKTIQYFVPIFKWLPRYNRKLLMYDILAGITIASLAIPQGISYAKLANVPAVIGLCKFLPHCYMHQWCSTKCLKGLIVRASFSIKRHADVLGKKLITTNQRWSRIRSVMKHIQMLYHFHYQIQNFRFQIVYKVDLAYVQIRVLFPL